MRGGALPPALMFAALGCALAFAPRGIILPAVVAALLAATIAFAVTVPAAWTEAVFLGLWTSVIATAALVHLPRGVAPRLALALALNGGLWAGLTTALAGTGAGLAAGTAGLLLCVPGAWLTATGREIAPKVLASWIVAVAVLAAMLPLTPTPGYVPDHME